MLKKHLINICATFSALVFIFLISILSLIMYFNAPNGFHKEDKKFIIEQGLTFTEVVQKLHHDGIIRSPSSFLYTAQLFKGYNPTVRYGEYFFEKNISYYKIMHKIVKGYVYFRKVTIYEGISSSSALKSINNSSGLIGEIPPSVPEGSLLPETYYYSYNDTKAATVKRMQVSMQKAINELWETRDLTVPLKSKAEAIILASIVEKETGLGSERPMVASVFVNRLRKGMKLQSDPTIIYSFTFGDKSLERPIRVSDIHNKSRYNTYNIYGLPPTPICNPGIDSIRAVLNPPKTDFLYFVATGNGDHLFSSNLQDHNDGVARYRQMLESKSAGAQSEPQAAPKEANTVQ